MWSDVNSRDAEPQLEIDDIQGDVLVGLQKNFEWFIFFNIGENVDNFKEFARKSLIPKISSAAEALQWQIAVEARAAAGQAYTLPFVGLNLGFTRDGLARLRVPGEISDAAFSAGMASRSVEIRDPREGQFAASSWRMGGHENTPHGVVLITGPTQEIVDRVKEELARRIPANENRIDQRPTDDEIANGWKVIYAERGMTRQTFDENECDVMMDVPAEYGNILPTIWKNSSGRRRAAKA